MVITLKKLMKLSAFGVIAAGNGLAIYAIKENFIDKDSLLDNDEDMMDFDEEDIEMIENGQEISEDKIASIYKSEKEVWKPTKPTSTEYKKIHLSENWSPNTKWQYRWQY